MKTGLTDAGPLQFATLRFNLAALCMIPATIRFRAPLPPRREQRRYADSCSREISPARSRRCGSAPAAALRCWPAWMLFYYALRRMPAGMVGLGTLATPVIGVLAALLQPGNSPQRARRSPAWRA